MRHTSLIIMFVLFNYGCNNDIKTDYYDNGSIKKRYSLKNNNFHGNIEYYYSDGAPHVFGKFNSGEMTGTWKYYYSNGELQSIQKYRNGKNISIDFWTISGDHIVKDGNGTAELLFPNGQIMSRMSYKNNKLDGEYITWHENGVKASEGYYNKGRLSGVWRFWDADGKQIRSEEY